MLKRLFWSLLLLPIFVLAEEVPEPEYPQPRQPRPERSNGPALEKPTRVDEFGTYYYSDEPRSGTNSKSQPSLQGVETPVRIDEDGTYHYGDAPSRERQPLPGTEPPVKKKDGAYFYAPKEKPKGVPKTIGEPPTRQDENGEFFYEAAFQPATKQFRFGLGLITPPQLESATGGLDYEGVYGTKNPFTILIEYDWTLFADVYLKISSGLTVSEGRGQFAGDPTLLPKENFQLYTFPNMATIGYRARTSQDPLFTPYVEGGVGYFTFLERRSDGARNSLGGAPVLGLTGGLQVSLSKYARNPTLTSDYGIRQMWLDLQFRQIIGLDQRKDFTSSLITAGFALGF